MFMFMWLSGGNENLYETGQRLEFGSIFSLWNIRCKNSYLLITSQSQYSNQGIKISPSHVVLGKMEAWKIITLALKIYSKAALKLNITCILICGFFSSKNQLQARNLLPCLAFYHTMIFAIPFFYW